MATLQVKNLPDDLATRLRERATDEGVTLSEYVTRLLRRDLDRPSVKQWLAHHSGVGPARPPIDTIALLDAVRDE
jgi:plasmid stability protein